MSSKAQHRRHRKAAQARKALSGVMMAETDTRPVVGQKTGGKTTPTPERKRRGVWMPPAKGQAGPYVDIASDMIGALLQSGKISHSQEQAARLFMDLRAGYVAELGVAGYGSCLDQGGGGYDSGDGNPEAIRAYRSMEDRIGWVKSALLQIETAKGAEDKPHDLGALRNALDVVNG